MKDEIGPECRVFLCYRWEDGRDLALWLHDELEHGTALADGSAPRRLNVYLDKRAVMTGDWRAVHRPALETSHAFVFVCSPGARARLEGTDWVHDELEWWLANRGTPPILVDPTGAGDTWIPDRARELADRREPIALSGGRSEAGAWSPPADAEQAMGRLAQEILLSEHAVRGQDLAEAEQRTERIRARSRAVLAIGAVVVLACVLAVVKFREERRLAERQAIELKASVDARIEEKTTEFRATCLELCAKGGVPDGDRFLLSVYEAFNEGTMGDIMHVAVLHLRTGNPSRARAAAEVVLESLGGNGDRIGERMRAVRALALAQLPPPDGGIEALEELFAAGCEELDVLSELGRRYLAASDGGGARAVSDRLVELDPWSAGGYVLRAQAGLLGGDLPDALDAARTAAALNDGSSAAWEALALVRDRRGEEAEAAEAARRAVALDPALGEGALGRLVGG